MKTFAVIVALYAALAVANPVEIKVEVEDARTLAERSLSKRCNSNCACDNGNCNCVSCVFYDNGYCEWHFDGNTC
jgi:hypothetical protein